MAAWLGATTLGVANAAVRELVYADRVGELAAHQLSTVTLLAALTYYIWLLDQRWPVPTTRTALAIGGSWAVLTVLFEFGLGRFALGSSWSELLANYDLADGRIWVLVPVWMALEPAVLQRLRTIRNEEHGQICGCRCPSRVEGGAGSKGAAPDGTGVDAGHPAGRAGRYADAGPLAGPPAG